MITIICRNSRFHQISSTTVMDGKLSSKSDCCKCIYTACTTFDVLALLEDSKNVNINNSLCALQAPPRLQTPCSLCQKKKKKFLCLSPVLAVTHCKRMNNQEAHFLCNIIHKALCIYHSWLNVVMERTGHGADPCAHILR